MTGSPVNVLDIAGSRGFVYPPASIGVTVTIGSGLPTTATAKPRTSNRGSCPTSAFSAFAIPVARSPTLADAPLPVSSSSGPASVPTNACSAVVSPSTAAAKNFSLYTPSDGRVMLKTTPSPDVLAPRLTSTGASTRFSELRGAGTTTLSSVAAAARTSAGSSPNETWLPPRLVSKPRPFTVTTSPGTPERGFASDTRGRRPRYRSKGFDVFVPTLTTTGT